MEFQDRIVQNPGQKKITKLSVDPNNANIITALVERDEGAVTQPGTAINAANLNKGNWRDDKSVSFTKLANTTLPGAKANETQIVTDSNGETWIIPPSGKAQIKLGEIEDFSNSTNGYVIFKSGLIIQWGKKSVNLPTSAGSSTKTDFNFSFTNACLSVMSTDNSAGGQFGCIGIKSFDKTGFNAHSYGTASTAHMWLAIGY